MSYLGVGISPGAVVANQGSNMKSIDRKIRLTELLLRFTVCAFALLALFLVVTDSEAKKVYGVYKKAKFTDMKAFVFLVTANSIAAAYSLLQALRCVVGVVKGSVLFSKPLAWAIFSGDQVIAYLNVAAIGAAAQSGQFAKFGEPKLQWMSLCKLYGKFCNQITEGVASAVFASLGLVLISGISAFSLFRLYGGNKKGQQNSQW